jgi:hypothetical protein
MMWMDISGPKKTGVRDIPSGKHTKNYGKSPFSIIAMIKYERVLTLTSWTYDSKTHEAGLVPGIPVCCSHVVFSPPENQCALFGMAYQKTDVQNLTGA